MSSPGVFNKLYANENFTQGYFDEITRADIDSYNNAADDSMMSQLIDQTNDSIMSQLIDHYDNTVSPNYFNPILPASESNQYRPIVTTTGTSPDLVQAPSTGINPGQYIPYVTRERTEFVGTPRPVPQFTAEQLEQLKRLIGYAHPISSKQLESKPEPRQGRRVDFELN